MSDREGKWTFEPDRGVITDERGRIIAYIPAHTQENDEHLVIGPKLAAAPAMAEALEYMADLFKGLAGDQHTDTGWKNDELLAVWEQANAALALARGEPSTVKT